MFASNSIALVVAAMLAAGCTATLAATYSHELDLCIAKGQASHSVPRYERCANAVDRWMCETRDLRCVDAGAP